MTKKKAGCVAFEPDEWYSAAGKPAQVFVAMDRVERIESYRIRFEQDHIKIVSLEPNADPTCDMRLSNEFIGNLARAVNALNTG